MKPWNEARLQIHDASGIEKPEDWMWGYGPNSVMYPIVKVERIEECVKICEDKIGDQWAADFPEIKSGDFPPDASLALSEALKNAVAIWYETNKPE